MAETNLAEIIKTYRLKSGLSIRKLAEIVGVSQASVSFYEANKRSPEFGTMKKIADAIHIPSNEYEKFYSVPNAGVKVNKQQKINDTHKIQFKNIEISINVSASIKDISLSEDEITNKLISDLVMRTARDAVNKYIECSLNFIEEEITKSWRQKGKEIQSVLDQVTQRISSLVES
jgi:transcriptional regulator with XRE-family HTH domain